MASNNQSSLSKRYQRIMSTLRDAEASVPMKIKEIGIEIAIIVFSVTFSIWLYNIRDNARQQEEVKVFLLGLKSDLENDVKEMQGDCMSYKGQEIAFSYFSQLPYGTSVNLDSLVKYGQWIYNSTGLVTNDGRYEGFKSAGKIGAIENPALQNMILDLYEEDIPLLLSSTDSYINTKNRLFDYINDHKVMTSDSTSNIAEVLSTEKSKNICGRLSFVKEILTRYENTILKMNNIIAIINEKYAE